MSQSDRRPRLYLDIDGCLSPIPPDGADPYWDPPETWEAWVDPKAFNQTPMPVAILEQLGTLDWVEVVWATTWPLTMIQWAIEDAGYPHLEFRHLCPSGDYDKFSAVRDDVEAAPSPFVWIDDHHFPDEESWQPPVPWLRIRPTDTVGITPAHWSQIVTWLQTRR